MAQYQIEDIRELIGQVLMDTWPRDQDDGV